MLGGIVGLYRISSLKTINSMGVSQFKLCVQLENNFAKLKGRKAKGRKLWNCSTMKQGIIQDDFPLPEDLLMAYSFPSEVIIIFGKHISNTGGYWGRILCRCIIDGCINAFKTQLCVQEPVHLFDVP